jgi:hypothetical protein
MLLSWCQEERSCQHLTCICDEDPTDPRNWLPDKPTMFAKLKALIGRVRIRFHALLGALVCALPILLDQLAIIDLHPLLGRVGVPEDLQSLVIGLLPFVLAFLKPLIHMEEPK